MQPLITCVAGEPSGDLLGSELIAACLSHPDLAHAQLVGIGGPHMQAEGFTSQWPMDQLSVRGYVEALKQLPYILKIRFELVQAIQRNRPDIYIGIDAPDFNLTVEKKCRALKIPTVHYISPSIWAWRGGRIHGIKKAVDHMLCIFPFEPKIYHDAGIAATYVGHPLASMIPRKPSPELAKKKLFDLGFLESTAILADETVIAVLPGSRKSEVSYIAPGFFQTIQEIDHMHSGPVRFLVPVAKPFLQAPLQQLKEAVQRARPNIQIHLIPENSSLVLEAADVVLIASGTATLEAALWKKPMVISYSVPWLTATIMRKQGYLPYVGLPNILCQDFVVPEFLQEDAVPQEMAKAILQWLNQPSKVAQLVDRFEDLHQQLTMPTRALLAQAIHNTMLHK